MMIHGDSQLCIHQDSNCPCSYPSILLLLHPRIPVIHLPIHSYPHPLVHLAKSLSAYVHSSISLCVQVSIHSSVSKQLSILLFIHAFIDLSMHLFILLHILPGIQSPMYCLSIHLYFCVSVHTFVYLHPSMPLPTLLLICL